MTAKATMHPFLTSGRFDVLAHRGASAECPPGNTWRAFRRAIELGADHIETDLQRSIDGRVVVFHAERLDDITTGSGAICDHRWDELQKLRYVVEGRPTGDGLVLFEDLLTGLPDIFLNIDVKQDDAVDVVVSMLQHHHMHDRVCVAAFDWHRIRRLRKRLGPGWCTALSRPEMAVVRAATWLRLPAPSFGDVVQVPRTFKQATLVDRRFVDTCHRAGIAVHVRIVNDPDEVERLRSIGVDAFITDRPAMPT